MKAARPNQAPFPQLFTFPGIPAFLGAAAVESGLTMVASLLDSCASSSQLVRSASSLRRSSKGRREKIE
jgi:hypothetical protein